MESIKELRKICKAEEPEHITIRFYRIFYIYPTKVCLILGLRPNFVTGLSFLMGIIGGYLYLVQYFLLGSIFFIIFFIFDYVDGAIARYHKSSSEFGAWFDTTCGHLLYPYFFFTLGLGVFFQTGIFWYALLGAICAMAKLIERSIPKVGLGDKELLKNQEILSTSSAPFWHEINLWVSHIAKCPVLFPVIFLCSFWGWETWFLWFFAIYLLLFALVKVFLTGWRIYRYN